MEMPKPRDMEIIMPCLPDDIAVSCLARLPRRTRAVARCVSRSWNAALREPHRIESLRLFLRIPPEPWVFVGLQNTECYPAFLQATEEFTRWLLIDPRELRAVVLRNPLAGTSADLDLRSAAGGGRILLPDLPDHRRQGFRSYVTEIFRWDALGFAPGIFEESRKGFACAGAGDFVYFAGGEQAERSACRYDAAGDRWEALPDMTTQRINCAGVVMDGKFFVLGGFRHYAPGFTETHGSAEFFDAATGKWSLLPGFFANGLRHSEESNRSRPAVAVVDGRLYAMQSYSNEIMEYDGRKLQGWRPMGYAGGDAERRSYCVKYELLGVGSELWAIEYAMGKSVSVYLCKPGNGRGESQAPEWSRVKISGTEGFDNVLTCTTLSV
uniref:F-box domain-containing protein n=1 Tax=Araucaria cunninghamii TaxID=56994 RepID=A0A0D6QV04_ARACU